MTINFPNRHFVRHYLEMVAAMFLGMALLGLPAVAALAPSARARASCGAMLPRCCCSAWASR